MSRRAMCLLLLLTLSTALLASACVLVGEARLKEVDGSGVWGNALLVEGERDDETETLVFLVAWNLTSDETYEASIREEDCDGDVLYELEPLEPDSRGMAISLTSLEEQYEPDEEDWVAVEDPDDDDEVVACGQVNPVNLGPWGWFRGGHRGWGWWFPREHRGWD